MRFLLDTHIFLWHIAGKQLSVTEIDQLPIRMEHLAALLKLPLHHRDPFDRLIIAQALAEGLPVLSSDPEFKKYPVQVIG